MYDLIARELKGAFHNYNIFERKNRSILKKELSFTRLNCHNRNTVI